MTAPALHRFTPVDFKQLGVDTFRLATDRSPPLSNTFRCTSCGKDKSLLGHKSFPIPGSRHRAKVCAGCLEKSKADTSGKLASASINAMGEALHD